MKKNKYRAWDTSNKEMYSNPFNGKIGGINDIFYDTGNWIYMQYTGLQDAIGVEIYEGDIIAKFDFSDPWFRSIVVWHLGAFGYFLKEDSDFIAFASNSHFQFKNSQSKKILVVGNIYEEEVKNE